MKMYPINTFSIIGALLITTTIYIFTYVCFDLPVYSLNSESWIVKYGRKSLAYLKQVNMQELM